jgi:hypothetical protein
MNSLSSSAYSFLPEVPERIGGKLSLIMAGQLVKRVNHDFCIA